MPAPILAAYDPIREDRAPVELALVLGELTGALVFAAAVLPIRLADGFTDPHAIDPDGIELAEQALERLRADTGVHARRRNDVSVPYALHALVQQEHAGLLVVGSSTRSRLGRVLPGSTAERSLHGAECPIALAPSGYRRAPLETIAVGFADSPEGHAALTAAHLLAARAGARLRVVAVLHPSGGLDAAMAHGIRPLRGQALEGRHRAQHEAALERAIAALPAGVDVESEVHVDDPADVLLRVSDHVDALVCGSRGYGPVRSVLLGGVSRRLVDGSSCPVLVLPRSVERPLDALVSGAAVPSTR